MRRPPPLTHPVPDGRDPPQAAQELVRLHHHSSRPDSDNAWDSAPLDPSVECQAGPALRAEVTWPLHSLRWTWIRAPLEVEIGPLQAEELAPAKARVAEDWNQRSELQLVDEARGKSAVQQCRMIRPFR